MTNPYGTDSATRDSHRMTALLGEQLRSRLPGYSVLLAGHGAALSDGSIDKPAVIIEVGSPALHVLCWVEPNAGPSAEWAPFSAQVRVVLRSRELDGNIADVVGDAVDVDGDSPEVEEILELVAQLITDDIRDRYDNADPALAAEIRMALRTYDSDPLWR
ncbi:MAG: hypothetical protein JWQ43_1290 [Glaciihabitans sp.]|nr:hypothetical protein [Glaciihabitans sp.]